MVILLFLVQLQLVLTSIFGDNFSFSDDTELPFGLPIRSYKSFKHAADEAAISRMYGGIHYRTAVEVGVGPRKESWRIGY